MAAIEFRSWNFISLIIFYYIVFSIVSFCDDFQQNNKFAVKISKTYKEQIEEYDFKCLYQITPETFIIEYQGDGQGIKILRTLSGYYKKQIISWEPVRIYSNTLEAAQTTSISEANTKVENDCVRDVDGECLLNNTGTDITIAISGIGKYEDLKDLETNIRKSLNHEFVKQKINFENQSNQENASFCETTYVMYKDVIIAKSAPAIGGNTLCFARTASNSSVAVLNIYAVKSTWNHTELQGYWTKSEIMSRPLAHMLDKIDIFVNAWSTTQPFQTVGSSTLELIEYGIREGRRGLGTIFMVPAGSTGNGLSNNINTITLGSIDRFGKLPYSDNKNVDASVITSGISDDTNRTSCSILTTSYENRCISSFSGLSAATAQIAGFVALGLEANPNLTLRDIQHLLVHASDHRGLNNVYNFRRNGAGKMFHDKLGFGLLDASKFVTLCKTKVPEPHLLTITLNSEHSRSLDEGKIDVHFFYNCTSDADDDCLTIVEQVLVSVSLKTNMNNLTLTIISPSGTESMLMKEATLESISESFITTHFWGEHSFGIWTARLQTMDFTAYIETNLMSVTIYGIHRTLNKQSDLDIFQKHSQTVYVCMSILIAVIGSLGITLILLVYFAKGYFEKIRNSAYSKRNEHGKQLLTKHNTSQV